jgi:DNA polymerase-3 subunit gamma/tau
MYQALYRKWRPQTFDEVIGQQHVTETLKNQIRNDRLSHAYLFIGSRGTGKTTCARILARAVNCEHPVDGNPCGVCAACRGILDGTVLDVVELDAASNNGVDNVRALREEALFSPTSVKKRVYIIDEVHMLSTAAFNALLKILEEPPQHLMFILATTELQKVPATILSRCQRHSFRRIDAQTLSAYLESIAAKEQLRLSHEAAELIARLAEGVAAMKQFRVEGPTYARPKGNYPEPVRSWYERRRVGANASFDFGGDALSERLPLILAEAFSGLMPMYEYLLSVHRAAGEAGLTAESERSHG